MRKAILAACISLISGAFTEAFLGSKGDFRGIGIMLSVAIMGGFIIYFNEKNSNK